MAAVLQEEEKARIRHHLGYLNVQPAASIQLGFPAASQPLFLVESAMNKIPETAVGIIRKTVSILDNIEDRLVDALDRLQAEKLSDVTLRADEHDALEREYVRWAKRLADDLGAPLNAYSERFRHGMAQASLSVPVQH
jgi:hypothetical protein